MFIVYYPSNQTVTVMLCAAGSVGIVTVDTGGDVCSFTPYFELWKLRLADISRAKVHFFVYHTLCNVHALYRFIIIGMQDRIILYQNMK